MKEFPHKPRSHMSELRQEAREDCERSQTDIAEAEQRHHAPFFQFGWTDRVRLANLDYAFEASMSDVRTLLLEACKYAEKSVQFGLKLHPDMFVSILALANICSQEAFLKRLECMNRADYTDPEVITDEIDFLTAELLARTSAEQEAAAKKTLDAAHKRLEYKKISPFTRRATTPLVAFAGGILKRDASEFDKCVKAELDQHRTKFATSDGRNDPMAFLDLNCLGLLKIAGRYGLSIHPLITSMNKKLTPRSQALPGTAHREALPRGRLGHES
jgi:hypothetical protein